MSQRVEVELDDLGRLIVSHELQQQLGLFSGATVVVEDETDDVAYVRVHPEQPRLINKDGVLVVQTQAIRDFSTIVRDEREQHIEEQVQRVNL